MTEKHSNLSQHLIVSIPTVWFNPWCIFVVHKTFLEQTLCHGFSIHCTLAAPSCQSPSERLTPCEREIWLIGHELSSGAIHQCFWKAARLPAATKLPCFIIHSGHSQREEKDCTECGGTCWAFLWSLCSSNGCTGSNSTGSTGDSSWCCSWLCLCVCVCVCGGGGDIKYTIDWEILT